MTPRYFCTSGIIGAGKTNLALSLANMLGGKPLIEPVDSNPYLSTFYNDIANNTAKTTRSAIYMQMFLLIKRFGDHLKAISMCHDIPIVGDRSIFEDSIFAKMLHDQGHIDTVDYQTYLMAYNILKHQLKFPIFIFINIDPEQALENVKKRNRGCETTLTLDYLVNLNKEYLLFRDAMKKNSILIDIPADEVYYPEKVVERLEELDKNLTYQDIHFSKL